MIAKHHTSQKWYFDEKMYGTIGCSFKPKLDSMMFNYDNPTNNIRVWEKLYIDRMRPIKKLFPLKY
jgi:hypothetical protein